MLSSIFLATSLMFFVSCQQQDAKKDDQKKSSYNRESRKGTYQKRGKGSDSSAMPTKKCPKDKPCPAEPKKTCPSGCKKKCCINETSISDKEEAMLQEKQEIISLQDLTNKGMPLEDLKAAIESDSLNIGE